MQEPKLTQTHWSKELEKEAYEHWKATKPYTFNKKTRKKIYSIDTPPPYINAPIHIGHATTYVLMDMFARYHRMTGHEVLFPLGLDRNGLPIEMAAEKKFTIRAHQVSREEFVAKCKHLLSEAGTITIDSFLKLGISFNSFAQGENAGDIYETDSPSYRALTQSTFIDLWNQGLIYEDERINNWDPELRTTIADSEIEYKDIQSIFSDINFTVKETQEKLTIGTTRPELICSCGAIIYNPKDTRYTHLQGKKAITPLYNKEVPILAHPLAQIDKGTGLVMMCSAGDLSDIQFFREMKLAPTISISMDGTMNSNAGFLQGLKVKEARKRIIEELKQQHLLLTQRTISHRTPLSERSGAELEFISMKEFYLKQLDYKKDMKKLANSINFYAPESKKLLLDWINSVSIDWPISRRRYYATEIPLWYCTRCKTAHLPPKGAYYQPWKEHPPFKKCSKCNNKEFLGEQRVLDTWFDSSITPLYILMYERDNKFFKKAFPCTLRPSGKEIVRTWGYYTLLRCYQLTKKSIFRDHWVNYHILDEHGKKMSKSVGNVIDPQKIIDLYGAEPFRLWAAVEGNLAQGDFRCSFERIQGASKTITKLWNIARFVSLFPPAKKPKRLLPLDQWILNEINHIILLSKEHYEQYDFHTPALTLKHFLWETFASHYLELAKSRLYNQDNTFTQEEHRSGLYTIHSAFTLLLELLAPITPMITYHLSKELYKKNIHEEPFPKPEKPKKLSFTTQELIELNSTIWKFKKDNTLSLKDSFSTLTLPKKFKKLEKDINALHHPHTIKYGNELNIER